MQNARTRVYNQFYHPRRYDLGSVGYTSPVLRRSRPPLPSKGAPDSSLTVAGQHGQRDDKLDQAHDRLERRSPDRILSRHDPSELKRGSGHAHEADQEDDQDQPEGPAPTADDADRQHSEERGGDQQGADLTRPLIIAR